MASVDEKVKHIIVEQLGVDEDEVKAEASFVDDLGADSLDVVELVMAFEDEFNLEIPEDDAERKAREVQIDWPHAYTRLEVEPDEFLAEYDSNHIHGVYGDWVDELVWLAKMLKMEYRIFRGRKR